MEQQMPWAKIRRETFSHQKQLSQRRPRWYPMAHGAPRGFLGRRENPGTLRVVILRSAIDEDIEGWVEGTTPNTHGLWVKVKPRS